MTHLWGLETRSGALAAGGAVVFGRDGGDLAPTGTRLARPQHPPREGVLRHPEPPGDAAMRFAVAAAGHGVPGDASAEIHRAAPALT